MKSFIKLMLIMGIFTIGLSGCIFDNDDDDEAKHVTFSTKQCVLVSSSQSVSNQGITTISKSSYGSLYIGARFAVQNAKSESVTSLVTKVYIENSSGTAVATFFEGTFTGSAGYTSDVLIRYNSGMGTISNLSVGTYNLVFYVAGECTEKVAITIVE